MRCSRKRTAGTTTFGKVRDDAIYAHCGAWVAGRNVTVESSRMSRRRFGHIVAGIVVASASPVFAQASKVVRRIGLLDVGIPLTPDQIQEYSDAFREFGWVE